MKTKAYHKDIWDNLRERDMAHVSPSQFERINRLISNGIHGQWTMKRTLAAIKRELEKGTNHVPNG